MLRRTILACIAIVVCVSVSAAQELKVLSVDDSNYPTMKARVSAVYADGSSERENLQTQLSATENGIPVGLTAFCNEPVPGTVDVVLSTDLSQSMSQGLPDGSGRERLELVKIGARAFLDDITFDGNIRVAISSYHKYGELLSGFSENEVYLNSIIDDFDYFREAGTDYDTAFLSQHAGALELLKDSPADRKLIVFLTDGQPVRPGCDGLCVDTAQIVQEAREIGVNIYAVTLQFEFTEVLQHLSDETGGAAFGEILTEEDARAVYQQIAEAVQGKLPCEVEWEAPQLCGERSRARNVELTWQPNATPYISGLEYRAPASSVAKLEVESTVVSFGNPELLMPELREIKYTARNSDFDILSLEPIAQAGTKFEYVEWQLEGDIGWNTDFTALAGNVIPRDKFLAVRVRFTQEDAKDLRLATVNLLSTPCDPDPVSLIAGGASSNQSLVTLISPIEGLAYNSCDEIKIQWTVDPPERPVDLYYRVSGSPDWELIEGNYPSDASGGSNEYLWNPTVTGDLEVRVVAAGEFPQWVWAWQGQSSGADDVAGLAITDDESSYVFGTAGANNIDLGGGKNITSGSEYIVKIDQTGTTEDALSTLGNLWGNDLVGITSDGVYPFAAKEQRANKYRPGVLNRFWNPAMAVAAPAGFAEPTHVDIAVGQSFAYVMGNLESSNSQKTPYGYIIRYDKENNSTPAPEASWFINSWTDAAREAGEQEFLGMAIGTGERVHLYGRIEDKTNFNGKPGLTANRYFIASFVDPDNDGNIQMRNMPNSATPRDIAVTVSGHSYIGGRYTSSPNFAPGLSALINKGVFDGYLVQYDEDMDAQWVLEFPARSGRETSVEYVHTDAGNNAYVLGYYTGESMTITSPNNAITLENSTTLDRSELFVAKVSPTGDLLWAVSAGGDRDELANGLQVDAISGDVTIAGVFADKVSSAGNAMCGDFELVNTGQGDIFVSRIRTWTEGSDATEGSFNVSTPVISHVDADPAPWVLPSVARNGLSQKTFKLRNDGNIDLYLNESEFRVEINGTPTNRFVVLGLSSSQVEPGQEFSVEIGFQPDIVAFLEADLVLVGECVSEFVIPLEGEGLPLCVGDIGPDVNTSARVGQTVDVTINDVLSVGGSEEYEAYFRLGLASNQWYTVSPTSAVQEFEVVTVNSATSFPVITLEFTPDRIGDNQHAIVEIFRIGCSEPLSLVVYGEGIPGDPVLDVDLASLDLGTLYCADGSQSVDRAVTISNTGGGILDVDLATNAPFSAAPLNFSLAEGESQNVTVTFQPTGTTLDFIDQLSVNGTYTDANNDEQTTTASVQLTGRNEIRSVEFVSVESFGSVAAALLPIPGIAEVRNTGNIEFTIDATMTMTPPFTLVDQNVTIPVGATESIGYTFDDPGDNAEYISNISITAENICSDVVSTDIVGQVAQGIADITIADVTADVRVRDVAMPIQISVQPGFHALVTAGTVFASEIRFDRTVFSPQRVAAGLCVDPNLTVSSEGADEKTLLVTVSGTTPDLEGQDGVLFTIYGDMLIGSTTTSTIDFTVDTWEQSSVAVNVDAGIIEGEGLCQAGGTRFVEKREYTPISSAYHDGSQDALVVDIEIVEGGEYEIEMFDIAGRKVLTTSWFESGVLATEGVRSVNKTLQVSSVPSGTYVLVLTAPRNYYTVVLPVYR